MAGGPVAAAANSPGVPCRATRPVARITMRSARRSASVSSCVVSTTQTPCSLSPATTARMVSRPSGSTPAVGSSRKATSGRPTRARARERRCCSPPERWRHGVAATAPQPEQVEQVLGADGIGVVVGEELEDAAWAEHGVDAAPLEHDADAPRERPVLGVGVEPQDAHRSGGWPAVALEAFRPWRSCRPRSDPGRRGPPRPRPPGRSRRRRGWRCFRSAP